jgi:UDP-glucose 4-epimerase
MAGVEEDPPAVAVAGPPPEAVRLTARGRAALMSARGVAVVIPSHTLIFGARTGGLERAACATDHTMRILLTGSSGHLGEALMRVLGEDGRSEAIGLDILPSPYTTVVGSISDRECVRRCMDGVDAVLHAATLHKPHVASNGRREFVDTNVGGTLNLLEEAVAAGVSRFVFTSSTTTFGRANTPPPGAPAAWITEAVAPVPKNIYGVTKVAAEDLCELFHREHDLPCVVLRTSRFFPEGDDRDDVRSEYDDLNLKVNELLYRRVDLEDVVTAHRLALERAPEIGFARLIVSATSPFRREDLALLGTDAPAVVRRLFPRYEAIYAERGWRMFERLDRVYVNDRAREVLGWAPRHDFAHALERLAAGEDPRSALTLAVGAKGYHAESFGPYTTR